MNKYAIAHAIESNYSFPLNKDQYVVRLRVSKVDDIDHIYVLYGAKHLFQTKRKRKECEKIKKFGILRGNV